MNIKDYKLAYIWEIAPQTLKVARLSSKDTKGLLCRCTSTIIYAYANLSQACYLEICKN